LVRREWIKFIETCNKTKLTSRVEYNLMCLNHFEPSDLFSGTHQKIPYPNSVPKIFLPVNIIFP
jgi:hypothetical protein